MRKNISMKKAQSRGDSGFAKVMTIVALMLMAATGAMAQTGYNGAALPAGPDMSGDVINVTAANAQYVLDGAYGSINGKTINFTENVTSLLDLARPTKYAGSGTTVSGTTYTRTLSNVTFTANSGVTLAGFYCTAGATNWSVNKDVMYLNNVYNYVTDGNGNYTSIKTVSNVTFDGLTINAPSGTLSAVFAFGKPGYLTMDGITITNCTITNSNGHGLYFCSLDQDCMQYGAISITNSIIQGTASDRSGVIIEGVGYSNTVITNNYIVGYHNAIQIENPGNGGSQPQSVTITGNFLKSNNKYPVNLYKLTSNMFTFTGNVVVAGASGKHVGHFHGNASGNFWAPQGATPDAEGMMTTTLTAPALYGNDNDVTSTSYYDFAIVNTSAETWVSFERTYNVTFKAGTEDASNWQGKAGEGEYQALPLEGVAAGTAVSVKYFGTKKVESVKAVKKAAPAPARTLAEATAEDLGKVVGADGKIYTNVAAAKAASTTAVAVIAYVGIETYDATFKNGLAIALADEGSMNWSTVKSTCEGKTAITGAKWCLPSQDQWKQMFKANGGNEGSYTGLNNALAAAGGESSKLQEWEGYWSSSLQYEDYVWIVIIDDDGPLWDYGGKDGDNNHVRACLAF